MGGAICSKDYSQIIINKFNSFDNNYAFCKKIKLII